MKCSVILVAPYPPLSRAEQYHHAASIVRVRWLFLSLPSAVRYTQRNIDSTGSRRKEKKRKTEREKGSFGIPYCTTSVRFRSRLCSRCYHTVHVILLSVLYCTYTCHTSTVLPRYSLSRTGVRISCPIFRYSYGGPPMSFGAPPSLASDVCSVPCGL